MGDGGKAAQGGLSLWDKKEADLEECRGCWSISGMEWGTRVWPVGLKRRPELQRVAGNESQCKRDVIFAEEALGAKGGPGSGREDSHSLEMLCAQLQYCRVWVVLHTRVQGGVAAWCEKTKNLSPLPFFFSCS